MAAYGLLLLYFQHHLGGVCDILSAMIIQRRISHDVVNSVPEISFLDAGNCGTFAGTE